MGDSTSDHAELVALVEGARAGDRACLDRLAREATTRLHEFVYRLTLQEDLTQDVVQETIAEMLQVFNKLRHVERFWYWLYGIAYNKLRRQYSRRKRRRAASLSDMPYELPGKPGDETVAHVVSDELKQIVLQAMQTLEPRHRAILTMRCYDQLSYAEIAGLMDCTEFGARALFYRAKKSLAKKLATFGLGKGALLTGLLVFGKMTAVNEASAAGVAVTAGTLEVGTAAAAAAMLTSKAALVAVTAGALATGTLVSPLNPLRPERVPKEPVAAVAAPAPETDAGRHWYFYPNGPAGPVMLRTEARDKQVETRWSVLQNAIGNYRWIGEHIVQKSGHWFHNDLSVMRLPTDSTALSTFLERRDGRRGYGESVGSAGRDLLVISGPPEREGTRPVRAVHHRNVLVEDYFQAYCPEGVTFVDERDPMRRRGWAQFTVTGRLRGRRVQGSGRLPFVYAALREHGPWLRLTLGAHEIVDTPTGAAWIHRDTGTAQRYAAGTFFQGLPRPWMGLHVVDTVRRDAAQAGLTFETERLDAAGEEGARVTVHGPERTLVYDVDLTGDLLEGIEILRDGRQEGVLRFDYLETPDTGTRFRLPVVAPGEPATETPDLHWLLAALGVAETP